MECEAHADKGPPSKLISDNPFFEKRQRRASAELDNNSKATPCPVYGPHCKEACFAHGQWAAVWVCRAAARDLRPTYQGLYRVYFSDSWFIKGLF